MDECRSGSEFGRHIHTYTYTSHTHISGAQRAITVTHQPTPYLKKHKHPPHAASTLSRGARPTLELGGVPARSERYSKYDSGNRPRSLTEHHTLIVNSPHLGTFSEKTVNYVFVKIQNNKNHTKFNQIVTCFRRRCGWLARAVL